MDIGLLKREWKGRNQISRIRIDLAAAYILTGIFGIAIVILAANLEPEIVKSNKIIIALANEMKTATGEIGSWIFLLGFWGAVTSSMLGVWQGVPYLFADFISTWRKEKVVVTKLHKSKYYIWISLFSGHTTNLDSLFSKTSLVNNGLFSYRCIFYAIFGCFVAMAKQ